MKKNFYFAPSVEEEMVLVESGIAASTVFDDGSIGGGANTNPDSEDGMW